MENLRQKLKIFNYRPLVLIFLGLTAGILLTWFIKVNFAITLTGIIISSIVLIFYSILHKKFKYIIIFCISMILSVGIFSTYINSRMHQNLPNMVGMEAQGEVYSIKNNGTLLNIVIKDVKVNGKNLGYNARLKYFNTYQSGYVALKEGMVISFCINQQEEISYQDDNKLPNANYIKNNIGATFTTNSVEVIDNTPNIRFKLISKIRENLRFGLNNFNGEMIYSAMFGDVNGFNEDLYDAYKGAGVAHLLAVSGLNVVLIVGILRWLMKKLHIKDWWSAIIISILLLVYTYLCNFSYSIVRATIMGIVLLFAPLFFSEYDLLSSTCFAGSLILIVDPIALFDLGALLSFVCVIGIAMIYPIFNKWTAKIPISNTIKDGFNISLATTISTMPLMALYLGYMQPVGLLSNIIIVPIFSVLFTIAFVVGIISLIFPYICYIMTIINPLFEWVNWLIIFIANNSKILVLPSVNFLTVLLFLLFIVFAGKYNLKRGLSKLNLVAIFGCILTLQMAFI